MRVIASQKLPRDSRETIFAARHQSVSQGPLGGGDIGWDRFGPGMGPGRAQDRTQAMVWMAPPETVTDV